MAQGTRYSVMTYMKKNLKKSGYICIYKSELQVNYTVFQFKKKKKKSWII